MMAWLQVWWLLLHGLFGQMVYPFPGPRVLTVPPPSSGLQVWWEADFGSNCSGACSDGSSQSTWADQSATANNGQLTPIPSVQNPCVASVYHTNQINGKPAVTFNGNDSDGSETCFFFPNNINISASTTTSFAVVHVTKSADDINSVVTSNISNGYFWWVDGNSGTNLQRLYQGVSATVGVSTSTGDTSWHQVNVAYNSATGAYAFRRDRAVDGSGTNALALGAITQVGSSNVGGGNFFTFNGQIAAILIYNRVLTGGEITTVETYLNGKYGL